MSWFPAGTALGCWSTPGSSSAASRISSTKRSNASAIASQQLVSSRYAHHNCHSQRILSFAPRPDVCHHLHAAALCSHRRLPAHGSLVENDARTPSLLRTLATTHYSLATTENFSWRQLHRHFFAICACHASPSRLVALSQPTRRPVVKIVTHANFAHVSPFPVTYADDRGATHFSRRANFSLGPVDRGTHTPGVQLQFSLRANFPLGRVGRS